MPANLKRLVRARMAETGESYQAALRHVRARNERVEHQHPECGGTAEADGWCPRCDDSGRCEVCGAPVEAIERFCPTCEDEDERDRRLHEIAHGPVRLG